MKKIAFIALLILPGSICLFSQTDEKLKSGIRSTGYVHIPLPLDYSKSFETFGLTKKVLVSDMLCDMEDMKKWSYVGRGGTPYWPQFNTATYKEVWGGSAMKWFMLIWEF
jgi:hypothetical protein